MYWPAEDVVVVADGAAAAVAAAACAAVAARAVAAACEAEAVTVEEVPPEADTAALDAHLQCRAHPVGLPR